ncbi:hypothetical protein JCM9279_004256 [Rhodotorula babjevae]
MESDEQKRDRQSKALGAAFLAHQVSQLEKSVDTLAFSRDPRLYAPGARGRGGRGGRASGSGGGPSGHGRAAQPRQVRVVDASALVHALPVLKRWVRDDSFQLVVPLSALSTLDLLKKAPNPLHDLARDATRFLETQLDISRQIHAAFSAPDADARTRVRPQAQGEELPWPEVERLFVVPADWVVELPDGVELPPPYRRDGADDDGAEPEPLPLPTANDIPVHLRSTLQCILYFHLRARSAPSPSSSSSPPLSSTSTSDRPPTAITYESNLSTPAPLAAPLAKLLAASTSSTSSTSSAPSSPRKRRPDKPEPDYLALSSGDALAYYLGTFFPSVSVSGARGAAEVLAPVAPDEVERARAWWRAQAQARQQAQGQGQGEREGGGGSGRGGRGGRGGGRGGGGSGRGSRGGRGGAKGGGGAGSSAAGDAPKSLYVP